MNVLDYPVSNIIEMPSKYYVTNHQGQLKFNIHLVKDEILQEQPIYRTDIGLLRYENGVYKRSLNDDILHIIQDKIGQDATDSRKREILGLIKHEYSLKPLNGFNQGVRIINVKNGFFNLTTKTFEPHNKFIHSTIQMPIEYDPEAQCPAIMEFLHDILDADGLQFVIEWLAYMCLPYTDPDKMLFLFGNGGNGKSTLMNIFKAFLGIDNITSMSLTDLQDDKFSRAHLYGKLGNICGDIDNRVLNNTGIIKSLTGGEHVYAQFKGIDGFQFQSFAKLMFSANELPMSVDRTHGYFRRLFILPFEKDIPVEKRVSRTVLDRRLTTQKELSGLLNLVIEAIARLEKNDYKFTIPQSAQLALQQYKHAHDKLEQFIDDECKIDKSNDQLKIQAKYFYTMYVTWCDENGYKAEAKRKITDQLKAKGYECKKSTGNQLYYFGISFHLDSEYSNFRR